MTNIDKTGKEYELTIESILEGYLESKGGYVFSTIDLNSFLSCKNGTLWAGKGESGFKHEARWVTLRTTSKTGKASLSILVDWWQSYPQTTLSLHTFLRNLNGQFNLTPYYTSVCKSIATREAGSVLIADVPDKNGTYSSQQIDLNEVIGIDPKTKKFVWGLSGFKSYPGLTNVTLKHAIRLQGKLDDKKITIHLGDYISVVEGKLQGLNIVHLEVRKTPQLGHVIRQMVKKYPKAKWYASAAAEGKLNYVYVEGEAGIDSNYLFQTTSASIQFSLLKWIAGEGADVETVDVNIITAKAQITVGSYTGYEAYVCVISARASVFEAKLGFGISSGVGIKDDSLEVNVVGCGFSVGKKIGISVFGNEFSIDLGKLFS